MGKYYNVVSSCISSIAGHHAHPKQLSSQLESLLIWKAFVTTYPDMLTMVGLAYRDQTLFNPTLSLSSYCMSIKSSSLDWINILSLNKVVCSRQDLIGICNLTNLGLLKVGPDLNILGNYRAGLDESILRNVGYCEPKGVPPSKVFLKLLCVCLESVKLICSYKRFCYHVVNESVC